MDVTPLILRFQNTYCMFIGILKSFSSFFMKKILIDIRVLKM